jgi:hypothetical protein
MAEIAARAAHRASTGFGGDLRYAHLYVAFAVADVATATFSSQ